MSQLSAYAGAPLLSPDPLIKYQTIQSFWHDVHALFNSSRSAESIIDLVLKITGLCIGADRAYTFSVPADRMHSSCTYEWTRQPELALRPILQNIDQRGLSGWLARFKTNSNIFIENVDNPPEDLKQPAAKFARDRIKSIYVFGFYDEGNLIGYLGVDYVYEARSLDPLVKDLLGQLASTLNLFILRHETLELWNRTAEELPSGLFIKDVDNDLRYAYANPRYQAMFGRAIVGHTDVEAYGEITGEQYRAQDRDCLMTGKPFASDGPQHGRTKTDSGYYSLIKFPVSTKMGRHYIAGFITDISAEHSMRVQAMDLLKKSKQAERSKSFFLAAMSHEIRTPLNAIIGLVDELQHDDLSVDTRNEYLTSVANSSHALLALINDVLDMSKIEAGQMLITPVETNMEMLFTECESIFIESCRGHGIALKCQLEDGFPGIVVDTTRTRQILFNLLSNAIKFTHEGSISLHGSFKRTDDQVGVLTLSVRDTGIGIAPADQEKVFGLFEQADSVRGTRVANSGTGLGLCLCKRLAQCMNGDISLDSALGCGSTFTVTLNSVPYFAMPAANEDAKSATAHITSRINRPLVLRSKVLIVDDVPMNLKVLSLILKRAGIEAVTASGGAEAIEKLNAGGIGYVLTDLWMPNVNGEDIARTIRNDPRFSNIRIAAQTADVEATNNFDSSLFDAILSKPITMEKVVAFLRGKPASPQV